MDATPKYPIFIKTKPEPWVVNAILVALSGSGAFYSGRHIVKLIIEQKYSIQQYLGMGILSGAMLIVAGIFIYKLFMHFGLIKSAKLSGLQISENAEFTIYEAEKSPVRIIPRKLKSIEIKKHSKKYNKLFIEVTESAESTVNILLIIEKKDFYESVEFWHKLMHYPIDVKIIL